MDSGPLAFPDCITGVRGKQNHDLRKRTGKFALTERYCPKCGWVPGPLEADYYLSSKGAQDNTVHLNAFSPAARKARELVSLYGDQCAYCNLSLNDLVRTLDHYIPLAQGGTNALGNMRLCCRGCNALKKDLAGPVWEMALSKNLCTRCLKALACNKPLYCCVDKWSTN